MTTKAKRLTPTQRLHEVTMASLTKQPRVAQEGIEYGQTAATKELYIKSLNVHRVEDEGWASWIDRSHAIAAYALEHLPADPRQNGEGK